jgi:predicted nucleic acid-binding protein
MRDITATEAARQPSDLLDAVEHRHDLIIAATARATRRTVITADPGAFADLPGVSWRSHR